MDWLPGRPAVTAHACAFSPVGSRVPVRPPSSQPPATAICQYPGQAPPTLAICCRCRNPSWHLRFVWAFRLPAKGQWRRAASALKLEPSARCDAGAIVNPSTPPRAPSTPNKMSFFFGRNRARTNTTDLAKQARDNVTKLEGPQGAAKVNNTAQADDMLAAATAPPSNAPAD